MGVVDRRAELEAAQRHARWKARQETANDERADAEMENRRRDFLLASGRVYFESIIDRNDLLPVRFLETGLLAAAAVGRIHLPASTQSGAGFATGFLIAPGLMITNAHVLTTEAVARTASLTMDAEDGVNGMPKPPRTFALQPGKLFVADTALDFAICAVAPIASDGTPLSSFGFLKLFGTTGKIIQGEFATIVQHPNGRQKHIAARDNKIDVYVYDENLTDAERAANDFLYYATDTLNGSSGAPVFSDQWYVVALHRRGVPKTAIRGGKNVILRNNGKPAAADDPDEVIAFQSNEGVRISRILGRLDRIAAEPTHPQHAHAVQAASMIGSAAGDPSNGPLSRRTAQYQLLAERVRGRENRQGLGEPAFEITHRSLAQFPSGAGYGYDPAFLGGKKVSLPVPDSTLAGELSRRLDDPASYLLPFRHFTTAMHARRRLPVFAAVNIGTVGRPIGSMPNRPGWSYDPRIDEAHQPDDSIFSNLLQRGHLAAREYIYWGESDPEIKEADRHSFTLTNVCPQIRAFNGAKEWYEVERNVADAVREEDAKVSEFLGPVLRADDPDYDSVRGANSDAAFGTRIRIPLRFWKIIVWRDGTKLKHKAMFLDQSEELDAAGPLELDIETPANVIDTTIKAISGATGLIFDWPDMTAA